MSRLAVIGTFYGRHENTLPLLNRVLVESTQYVDEFWMMFESAEDAAHVPVGWEESYPNLILKVYPTPKNPDGSYAVIPYSNKINWALDHVNADYIAFLDNGSMPDVRKYELMFDALEAHPEWGAVFCSQHRTGFQDMVWSWNAPIDDGYCKLNYTQVMYRNCDARWTLDMHYATPNDVADGIFWRSLHAKYGPFFPVAPNEVLDTHHIPSLKAVGV